MILVPANIVEKIKYFSTLLGLIFIEITRGPFMTHKVSMCASTNEYARSDYIGGFFYHPCPNTRGAFNNKKIWSIKKVCLY